MLVIAESHVEKAALHWLEVLGYGVRAGADIAPDALAAERASYGDVVLSARLAEAVARLNPDIPEEARAEALRSLFRTEFPGLVEENRRLHGLITLGVPVEFYGEDGVIKGDHVRLVDFDTARLSNAAVDLGLGGVGYYPRSDFLHVDTGDFRTWGAARS